MEFVKTRGWTGMLLFLLMIGFASCNDGNDLAPITMTDREGSNVAMVYRGEDTSEYAISLQGGDGHYSVLSGNEEVVTVWMVTSNLHLKPQYIGETIVTVTDNSQNTLILSVRVDYETHRMAIVYHDISVTGDDLTGNEMKAIKEKQLNQMPVKVGGGYKFTFTDAPNSKGIATIYPETYGSGGVETTFEYKKIEVNSYGYEVKIGDEKRLFILGKYNPSEKSTRSEALVTRALKEDVTEKVQAEYPKAEFVYTSQVIEEKTN